MTEYGGIKAICLIKVVKASWTLPLSAGFDTWSVCVCVSQTPSVLENKRNRGAHTQTAVQRRGISEGGTVVVWNTVYKVQTAFTEHAEKSLRKEEVGEGWSSTVTEEKLMVDLREQEYSMSVERDTVTVPSPSLNMKAGIVWFSFTGPELNNMFLEQCLTFNKIFGFIHLLNWYFNIWNDQSYCQNCLLFPDVSY